MILRRLGDLIRFVGEGTLSSISPSGIEQDLKKHKYTPKLDVIRQVVIGAGRAEP
jgi:hypothetical protein